MGRKSRLKRQRRSSKQAPRDHPGPPPVKYPARPRPPAGSTPAERALTALARHTFLSLWSYPNVVRDEHVASGHVIGKEIVDLLVVFENNIVLFSDKDCAFPSSGNLDTDWSRWYRKAIAKSAKQLWGADRHIRQNPGRVFIDAKCKIPLPIPLPDPLTMRIHRVVVAHGAAARCKEELGGSGSLMLTPQITGDAHTLPRGDGGQPFAIGGLHPHRPFVHVLDDVSLVLLLRNLDTVSDFVAYLTKKESFLLGGHLATAAGEEALLAHYIVTLNEKNEHDFVFPSQAADDGCSLILTEQPWQDFLCSPEYKRKHAADRVSYFWDRLIERFTKHYMDGTSDYLPQTASTSRDFEQILRFFARENRFKRRLLSDAIFDMHRTTPPSQRRLRVIPPAAPGDPYWVLLLFPSLANAPKRLSYNVYRDTRRAYLSFCARVVKLQNADALDIVGFATESGRREVGSEDAVYLDARSWTLADQNEARRIQTEMQILVKPDWAAVHAWEYPPDRPTHPTRVP